MEEMNPRVQNSLYLCEVKNINSAPTIIHWKSISSLSASLGSKNILPMEKRKDGFLIGKRSPRKRFHFWNAELSWNEIQQARTIDKVLVQKELNNDLIKDCFSSAKLKDSIFVRVPDAKLIQNHRKIIKRVVRSNVSDRICLLRQCDRKLFWQ